MAKTILEEAMEDAKLLKETAIANAKNVLVEAISPQIREFVDSQLGETAAGMYEEPEPEDGAAMHEEPEPEPDPAMHMHEEPKSDSEHEDDDGHEEKPEHEDEAQDLELLAKLLKQLGVHVPGGMGMEEAAKKEKDDEDEKDMEKVDEVVEITNEDLKSALSEVLGGMNLKSEARVTKGFGDAQDPTPKNAGGKGETGLADEKSGEHHWKDETPPDAKDWTVKESFYKKKIALAEKANAALVKENQEYKQACQFLKRNLQEVNLFNSKLLYTNKLLHSADLNNKQRLGVIEAFDRAQSLREVELVYKSLSESLKIAGVLGESRQSRPSMKGPKSSRFVTSSSTVLQESAQKEGDDGFTARMQELAGLVD